jgi:EAL domain-containing protein (putative c-di-GMP-specific phosphodiesterase class I)
VGSREVYTTVSIGVAVSSMGYERPEEILRDADVAMYRAKGAGGAVHEVFNRAIHSGALDRLNLETDLRRALQRQEFELYYQPIFALAEGRVAGFEALIRWRHPVRGLVAPDRFIPVAEEMGLILPLGGWVLAEACEALRGWQERFPSDPPLVVSVNLSPRQLGHAALLDEVARALAGSRVPPRSLRLEITESAIVDKPATTAGVLRSLKRLGIGLCIDDFGTGYSSLASLQHYPIDGIKIDRSFITAMGGDGGRDEIVRAVIGLAHSLHMEVVAEGVETDGQLARIRQMGCDLGQGFLLAPGPLGGQAAGRQPAPAN